MTNIFEECKCPTEYSIEPHGDGFALYLGRCGHRHGYNLINMKEPAWNFDAEHLSRLLNIGAEHYKEENE